MYHVYYLYVEGDDQPFYVGKTNRIHKRKIEHLSDARRFSNLRARKISKAITEGKEIILKVMATVETEDEALAIEVQMIALHGRRDTGTGFLCNHTDGGEGTPNWTCTEETRLKMSVAKMGHKINVGRKRPDMVKRFSKTVQCYNERGEWLFTCSSAREAAVKTGVHFNSVSTQLLGKTKTAKSDSGIYQFRHTYDNADIPPVIRRQMFFSYRIVQREKNGTFVASYRTAKEATNLTGITGIASCLSGNMKTSGGFLWSKETLTQL